MRKGCFLLLSFFFFFLDLPTLTHGYSAFSARVRPRIVSRRLASRVFLPMVDFVQWGGGGGGGEGERARRRRMPYRIILQLGFPHSAHPFVSLWRVLHFLNSIVARILALQWALRLASQSYDRTCVCVSSVTNLILIIDKSLLSIDRERTSGNLATTRACDERSWFLCRKISLSV